jgi:hypothetical protein
MASALRRISQRARRDFAEDAHGQAGAGERLAPDDFLGQTEFQAEQPDLVLEQAFQRLDELELHVLRQAADVVMALDERGGIAGDRHGLDDVGIQRALREKFRLARALRRGLKTSMNVLPMILRLRSGSVTPFSFFREILRRPRIAA